MGVAPLVCACAVVPAVTAPPAAIPCVMACWGPDLSFTERSTVTSNVLPANAVTSTRLFVARPAFVPFVSSGSVSPFPCTSKASSGRCNAWMR